MESADPLLRRITRHPEVLRGVAVVRDTGISVAQIVRALATQTTEAEILFAHPALELTDIRAALHYTALILRS